MTLGKIKQKLEKLSILGNEPLPGNSVGNVIAQEALAELNTYMERLKSEEFVEEVLKKAFPESYEVRDNVQKHNYKINDSKLYNSSCVTPLKHGELAIKAALNIIKEK